MTTFIITGDWHIRIKPDIPESWQESRYRKLFRTIIKHCKEKQAKLILSGDIFDKNKPALLELQLFVELVTRLEENRIETYLIAGNHEVIGQGRTTFDYLQPLFGRLDYVTYCFSDLLVEGSHWIYLEGHPSITDPNYEKPVLNPSKTNILVSHFRPTVNKFIQEEVDVAALIAGFDYVFASDIHMPYEDGNLIYTNHPLNSSFEAVPNCGFIELTLGESVEWKRVPLALPNLIQISTTAEEYTETLDDYHYYRIEVSGSPEELRQIITEQSNVKLQKVPDVVEAYVEQEVQEEKVELALEDGLMEYLQGMQLDEQTISKMMKIFLEVA